MTATILRGDALHIPLADGSVQCCVTSPPYWGLRKYEGVESSVWGGVEYTPLAGLPPITVPEMTCCLGLEPTPDMYVAHIVAVFREIWRVLRRDGTVWLNLGDSYASTPPGNKTVGVSAASGLHGVNGESGRYRETLAAGHATKKSTIVAGLKPKDLIGIPWRVAFALQADGWWLRSAIIWAKGISFCDTYSGSTMPESVVDRPTKAHEDIFLLTKSARYFYDHEAVKEASIYAGKIVRNTSDDAKNAQMGQYGQTRTGFLGEVEVASTRNLRDVWAISPTPYKAAHFATFSPSLVEPCVKAGTSERGCCPRCGAPWERVVEKELVVQYECRHGGYHAKGNAQGMVDLSQSWTPGANHVTTLGWRPTCGCPAHDPVPCTVLDPFAGAGTTVLVADRLGRRGVGVEISEDYCRMAYERLYNDAPLLAWAEASS